MVLFFLAGWLLVAMLPKLPNTVEFWFDAAGVAGLLAQAPEFHELAARAFMEGAASLALAFPRPSSEINPDAFAQISLGFEAGALLLFYRYMERDRVSSITDPTLRDINKQPVNTYLDWEGGERF